MRIIKDLEKIVIHDSTDFNVVQTLNCGQIFRFVIDGEIAYVYSKDKRAILHTFPDRIEIYSSDLDYFYHFFDLERDYGEIKSILRRDSFLESAVDFGYGIRIINNDAYEMLVSFIISANNNIGRIKKSIEYLCTHFGTNCGEYFAFPALKELKRAQIEDFRRAGLGYRAEQMFDTIQRLKEQDIEHLKSLPVDEQFSFLVSLKGIGEKVANCIMLFGLGVKTVFPVDTWINKVYNNLTETNETDRKKIARVFTSRYKELSGYAQQYFFYYYRDNKLS